MAIEDVQNQVLEHLKKKGQTNTFRLARELGIDRHKLLRVIDKLRERGAIELRHGNAIFLKFLSEEKKAKIVEIPSAPKIKAKHKAKTVAERSAMLIEKQKLVGSLQYENKKLKEKLLEFEASVKRQHYTKTKKFREQDELIEKLENRIKALQEKVESKPKIITRKIEVPKIIIKTIVKRVIKRVPVELIKKVPVRAKEKPRAKEFKLPKINLPNIKNIQRLERPEFLEQKIRAGKFNFSGLNKNIQQLHVPEMLRNN